MKRKTTITLDNGRSWAYLAARFRKWALSPERRKESATLSMRNSAYRVKRKNPREVFP
jgi:hypothetical protein